METTWNDQKNYLCHLILQISRIYGADVDDPLEKRELKEYCKDIVQAHKDDLAPVIECFERLIQQAKDCGWIKYSYKPSVRFTEADRGRPMRK